MNFFDYNSQKSLKPPSSKPPLSRKSNASGSRSKDKKPKEVTLAITLKDNKSNKSSQKAPKKMTLM